MVSAAMAAVSVLESHCLDLSVCRKPCGIGWQSGKRTTVIPDGVCSVDAELDLWVFDVTPGDLRRCVRSSLFLVLARMSGDTANPPSTTYKSLPSNLSAAYLFKLFSGRPIPAVAIGM